MSEVRRFGFNCNRCASFLFGARFGWNRGDTHWPDCRVAATKRLGYAGAARALVISAPASYAIPYGFDPHTGEIGRGEVAAREALREVA
jgi:hypothetical protein